MPFTPHTLISAIIVNPGKMSKKAALLFRLAL